MKVNQIICGDNFEVMKNILNESVDLIVTSPPYNVGKNYGEANNDSMPYEDYLNWLDRIWNECFRVLLEGGRLCINVNDTGRNPYYPVHCDIASRLRKNWFLMGIIIWDKQTCLSNTAWGSWQSPTAPSLRGQHEFIIVAGKNGKVFRKANRPGDTWTQGEFLKYTLEIWRFVPETKDVEHPAPFPLELPSRLIKLYSYVEDIIFDPFCGSGTTCVAAKKLNRRYFGIDISRNYCEFAKMRLKEVDTNVPPKEQKKGQGALW